MKRRNFIKGMSIAGLGVVSPIPFSFNLVDEKSAMPMGILGRTNEKVSKLGFGCYPFSWEETTVDLVVQLLHQAVDHGVTYIDTAPNYRNAEEKMGHVIPDIRDKIFLVSKTEDGTYEGTWKLVNQSLERMKTDRLDLVHLHNLGNTTYFPDIDVVCSEKGAIGALQEAQKQGMVKYIGASGHMWPTRFHKLLDHNVVDVLMNAVNYIAQHTYDFESKVWARAMQDNIGLVAMKVLGGLPSPSEHDMRIPAEDYVNAIRYAYAIPGVSNAVIGFKTMDELDLAVKTVKSLKALTEDELFEINLKGLKLSKQENWKASYGKPLT